MDKLNYFVGKLCTVITYQSPKLYNDEQHANTFTGIVEEVNPMGVWMRLLPQMTRKAFFAVPLCGIVEEEMIPITEEEEKQIREAYVKEASTDKIPENLLSLGNIKSKVAQVKTQFGAKK
jgi:hypothetical protein